MGFILMRVAPAALLVPGHRYVRFPDSTNLTSPLPVVYPKYLSTQS